NANMTGIIGFLEVGATSTQSGRSTLPTGLSANLTFDVVSPAPGTVAIANPRFGGSADINLTLTGSFNAAFKYQVPSIATDFQMHWDLGGAFPTSGTSSLGAAPTVNFNNVRVSLGQFLSKMVKPLVEDIQQAIGPLAPVLQLLNARVPGISEMSETAGLG